MSKNYIPLVFRAFFKENCPACGLLLKYCNRGGVKTSDRKTSLAKKCINCHGVKVMSYKDKPVLHTFIEELT